MRSIVVVPGLFAWPPGDRSLLLLKDRFDRLHEQIEATDMEPDEPFTALCDEADRVAGMMAALPTKTIAGAHAKLDVVGREFWGGDTTGVNEVLFRSALDWLRAVSR
jgi:hypothetical protein